ncbi:MAG TPA: hypothetical protein VLK85_21090 [Ramlibacter sp.]|nr:hypothetical protein [Ramlibacter sp.]
MAKLLRWRADPGHWSGSDFLGLPLVQREEDLALQRWQVVAGGLALVLSRLSESERNARFPVSLRLYRYLRERLRSGRPVQAAPEVLSDVMHELAGEADPATIRCLRSCFDERVRPSGDTGDSAPGELRATGALESQPRPPAAVKFSATLPTSGRRSGPAGRR